MQNLVPRREKGRSGYQVRWSENGKRYRRGFKLKGDAWEFAKLKERELQLGRSLAPISFSELFDRFLAAHQGAKSTKQGLRWRLNKCLASFGEVPPEKLTLEETAAFRATLGPGHAFEVIQALRQAIRWGATINLCSPNHPALSASNPTPRREEKTPFEWEEVLEISETIHPRFASLIILAACSGLRPQEWASLRWRDVDTKSDIPSLRVSRRLTSDRQIVGETKNRVARTLPLTPNAVQALKATPKSINSDLVFPSTTGDPLNLDSWRRDHWRPTMRKVGFVDDEGKPTRTPYALRHTFCARALRAGLSTFTVARRMGTSVALVDRTYGHLAVDQDEADLLMLAALESKDANPRLTQSDFR